ncbi:MAG: thermonuclease family protein [Candidatus Thiodiazotropha sp.]
MHPHLRYPSLLLLFGLFALLAGSPLFAGGWSGRVSGVLSGVEIQVTATGQQPQRIRLAGIRPISGQRHLLESARRHLATLLGGRHVEVLPQAAPQRGVIIGRVLHGGSDTATAMLKAGLVEIIPGAAIEPEVLKHYRAAQEQARSRNMGYWQTRR